MRPLDIALCIIEMHPPGKYLGSVTGNTQGEWNKVTWLDKQYTKPTWDDLNNFWNNNQSLFNKYYNS